MTSQILKIDVASHSSVLAGIGGPDHRRVGSPPVVEGARVAVVGLGLMGARHVTAALRRRCTIVGLVDPSAKPHAIQLNPDLASLRCDSLAELPSDNVDLLVIATTADLHHRLAIEAIGLGFRRIVIEKPVSQSVDEAIDIKLRSEDKGVRVIVNHGRRYCDAYARVRHLKEEMGDIKTVTLRFGGGALGCVGTHWIDLANTLIDARATHVFATETQPADNPRGMRFNDPGASLMIVYENGASAFIDTRDDVGFMGGAAISFSKGELTWTEEFGPWTLRRRRGADLDRPLARYGTPLFASPFSPSATALDPNDILWRHNGEQAVLGYAQSAMDDALGDHPPISGIDAAIQTMRIYAAARASHVSCNSVCIDTIDPASLAARFSIP
ncbi:Gfo/Idh/MocA family oxidoreductase [Mesorhizobium sp. AR07]|uniref:Gfo/Idh/MocA family protein n=1 Tax=Mesorhizobium sp. AR07 TaxID=2865838 RepID=UPI0029E8176B|nr:Gfo/Idh/MocA family oxidoreductase [Mesorhizobium sp. AR07]